MRLSLARIERASQQQTNDGASVGGRECVCLGQGDNEDNLGLDRQAV